MDNKEIKEKISALTKDEIIKFLIKLGWTQKSGKGSHVVFRKKGYSNFSLKGNERNRTLLSYEIRTIQISLGTINNPLSIQDLYDLLVKEKIIK